MFSSITFLIVVSNDLEIFVPLKKRSFLLLADSHMSLYVCHLDLHSDYREDLKISNSEKWFKKKCLVHIGLNIYLYFSFLADLPPSDSLHVP